MGTPIEELKSPDLIYVAYVLCALYAMLVVIPATLLARIHIRTPNLGWTTQKLFLCLTLISSLVRCVFFVLVPSMKTEPFFMVDFHAQPLFAILDTLPQVLYFTTYTLLILFWAEIIHHAQNQSLSFPQKLQPIFIAINTLAYLMLFAMWGLCNWEYSTHRTHVLDIIMNMFFFALSVMAAIAFVVYGGRLYVMLKQFPIESRGRRAKLKEVGWVTIVCSTCFTARAVLLLYTTFAVGLYINGYLMGGYFLGVEVLPSLLVLYILRKLPPKKKENAPTPINTPYTKVDPRQFDRYDSENYRVAGIETYH